MTESVTRERVHNGRLGFKIKRTLYSLLYIFRFPSSRPEYGTSPTVWAAPEDECRFLPNLGTYLNCATSGPSVLHFLTFLPTMISICLAITDLCINKTLKREEK
jgi:hypothetical protein